MKWEKLPNGKWKPLKEFKQSSTGKYDPADPVYRERAKRKKPKWPTPLTQQPKKKEVKNDGTNKSIRRYMARETNITQADGMGYRDRAYSCWARNQRRLGNYFSNLYWRSDDY